MNIRTSLIAFLVAIFVFGSNNLIAQNASLPREYNCHFTKSTPKIDGILNETSWQMVSWSENFRDIVGGTKAAPEKDTRMKMMWDDDYLYIAAYLEENHIWANLKNKDAIIYRDNDFEVFFDPDGDGLNYFELEVNALGTIMDLFMAKPYNKGGKADLTWDFEGLKSAVKIYGSINNPDDNDVFWTVEMAIPWSAFNNQSKPQISDEWRINFSRVEWTTEIVDGKYVKKKDAETSKPLAEDNWVWSPQGVVNMHIPEKWGRVKFVREVADKKSPKFWMWMNANTDWDLNQWKNAFERLSSAGINGLLVAANEEVLNKVIPLAHCYDMQVHAWFWTMNRGEAKPEWLSVNALGKSLAEEKAYVDYYKFMCPALPEVRNYLNNKILKLSQIEGLQGIHFDYIRYVDVFLPKELQPKYGLVQNDIMPEFDYGYHPYMRALYKSKYGIDPMDLKDYAHDKSWLDFRLKVLDTTVIMLRDLIHEQGLKSTAAVFPSPDMSRRMVRQDWDKWGLDYYFPMIYHNFYGEDINWIKKIVKQDVKAVGSNSKVFAGLYLPALKNNDDLKQAIKAALKGGANGISFFGYGALSDEMLGEIWAINKNK
ncbi:MAG: hypothetical protein C0595_11275 [Marinilabiliales bacterium]|nr:MAG: hypothetical protein C0595_11275 [Marinilabiliales bacterium]